MTIKDIVDKRRLRWQERHDIEYDRRITETAAALILENSDLLREVLEKPYLLIEAAFTVVDKKKRTVPFFLNAVQHDFLEKLEQYGTKRPFFILKGRQQGFTTLITAIQLSFAIVRKNFSGFTLADRADNTAAIFNDKARMVYSRLPPRLKPKEKFNSRNELFFDRLNSSWRIATATGDVGRSRTLNFVHFSEAAFYDCSLSDLQAGIGEAMTEDCFRVFETTANGYGESKDLWDSGSCINLFYEWWKSEEYVSDELELLDTDDGFLKERIRLLGDKGLSKEQIAWYCRKYSDYLDKRLICQEYPVTPEEAFISSGNSIFDSPSVENRIAELTGKKFRRGIFTYDRRCTPVYQCGGTSETEYSLENIRFTDTPDGFITIHKEPITVNDTSGCPIAHHPYVLGGDTAGSGNDYFIGKMIDNMTGESVATLRVQRIDEDIYAEQMLCLAVYYFNAFIAVETNYSRMPLRIIEQKYGYSNIYMRERLDKGIDEITKVSGFETTRKTKPIIIGNLVALMREDPKRENDIETLKEMLTFIRKENGSTEAISGMHDDLVMALAIAHFCAGEAPHEPVPMEKSECPFIEANFNIPKNEGAYIKW